MKTHERSRSLQIYMKPGIREDELLLRVWNSCAKNDRPQDVFRAILRHGLIAMIEAGQMPEAVVEECNLETVAARKRRRTVRHEDTHMAVPPPQAPSYQPPYAPNGYAPYQSSPGRGGADWPRTEPPRPSYLDPDHGNMPSYREDRPVGVTQAARPVDIEPSRSDRAAEEHRRAIEDKIPVQTTKPSQEASVATQAKPEGGTGRRADAPKRVLGDIM